MIKFNSTNIFVGEIKEILKSFNLPSYKVLVQGEPVSIFKDFSYIYSGMILVGRENKDFPNGFIYDSNDFLYKDTYYYNQPILNITHNLVIKNVNYDYLTHNRLGNYLRFIRDYKDVNLMSMYNCFNGQSANNIDIDFDNGKKIFNTDNNSYKIFTIPAKYNKKYTFFVDCPTNLEIVACYYLNNNQLNDLIVNSNNKVLENYLYPNTYYKINASRFNTPFVYDKLNYFLFNISNEDVKRTLAQKELELTLLLKLPKDNNSSIVVLEGDYTQDSEQRCYSDMTFSTHTQYIINFDNVDNFEQFNKFNSYKQLTYINDNNSYPFANRLIEYLIDNAITPLDDIELDTKRVESNLIKNKVISVYTPYYDWTNELRTKIYLEAQNKKILNSYFDILGYVDKDVEEKVVGYEDTTNEWEG